MRIAYVTVDPGIPVFGTKGASVHIQEVVRELIRRGHDVTVHTTRAGRDIPDDLAGLEVIETRIDADDPGARERAQQEVSARIAARIIAGGADLVYERYSLFSTALAEVTDATGAVGVLEVNAPLIEEQRTHRVLVDEEAAGNALARQVAAATATIAVSDPVRDWVRERTGSDRVHTVPNGVSITRIVPRPEEIGDPVVTFVGTLKPWHGVADLLAAAAPSGPGSCGSSATVLNGPPWRSRPRASGSRWTSAVPSPPPTCRGSLPDPPSVWPPTPISVASSSSISRP